MRRIISYIIDNQRGIIVLDGAVLSNFINVITL